MYRRDPEHWLPNLWSWLVGMTLFLTLIMVLPLGSCHKTVLQQFPFRDLDLPSDAVILEASSDSKLRTVRFSTGSSWEQVIQHLSYQLERLDFRLDQSMPSGSEDV